MAQATKRFIVEFKDSKGKWQKTGIIDPSSFETHLEASTAANKLTKGGSFEYRSRDTKSGYNKRFIVEFKDNETLEPTWKRTMNNPSSYDNREEAERAAKQYNQNFSKLEYRVVDSLSLTLNASVGQFWKEAAHQDANAVPVADFFKEPVTAKQVGFDYEAAEQRVLKQFAAPDVRGYYNSLKEHAEQVFGPAPTYKTNAQGLTAAEEERLVILAEEAGEVVQAVAKVLRHGYNSSHPTYRTGVPNRSLLAEEVGHMAAVVRKMEELGDIAPVLVSVARRKKNESIEQYLHHDSWTAAHQQGVATTSDPWHKWGVTRPSGYAVCFKCSLSDVYAGRESFCPKADKPTAQQVLDTFAKENIAGNTPKSGVYLGDLKKEGL